MSLPVASPLGSIALRAPLFALAASFSLLLSGCPLGDDYVIEADARSGAGTPAGGATGSGGLGGGGSGAAGTTAAASSGTAGVASAGQPGVAPCQASRERCNGLDDDCDSKADQGACKPGCTGLALRGHGYMFCSAMAVAAFNDAKSACAVQGQHLVWLEDAAEAVALHQAINPAISGGEYYLGATDVEQEGAWHWVGGAPFWNGDFAGRAVSGAYANWRRSDPNGSVAANCAVVVDDATWRDRACSDVEAFVCEDP